jgi:hypothetical protein
MLLIAVAIFSVAVFHQDQTEASTKEAETIENTPVKEISKPQGQII